MVTRLGNVSGFGAAAGGNDVGGVARFHPISSPPRSEQPIEIPAHRALIPGDAVAETGGGELHVWEDPLDSQRRRRCWHERYLPALQRLAPCSPGMSWSPTASRYSATVRPRSAMPAVSSW